MTVNIDLDSPFQIGNTKHLVPLRDMLAFGSLPHTQVSEGVPAGATGCTLNHVPLQMAAHLGYVVLRPFSVECQVRKITGLNGDDITWGEALDWELDTGDPVIWTDSPVLRAKWFGAKGDGVTDDTIPLQRCWDQLLLPSISPELIFSGIVALT